MLLQVGVIACSDLVFGVSVLRVGLLSFWVSEVLASRICGGDGVSVFCDRSIVVVSGVL